MHDSVMPLSVATRKPQRQLLVSWVVIMLFVLHALYSANGVVIDDAYIAFRYSKNLAAGIGLTFQAGPPVEGFTCFSWVLLGALLARVGLEPAAWLPPVGIACGAAAVAMVMRWSRRTSTDLSPTMAGLLPGVFLAASPGLAYYSGSGLETGLYALLVVVSVTAALEDRAWMTALGASAAVLTRPEGVVVSVLSLCLGAARAGRGQRRRWILAIGATLAVALLHLGFRWAYFGAWLPNTALAKPPVLRAGLTYVGWGLVDAGPILLLTAILLLVRRGAARHRSWAIGIGAVLIAVAVVEGGDWMPAGRLLTPAFAVAALAFDAIAAALFVGSRRARIFVGVAGIGGLGFYLYWSSIDTRRLAADSVAIAHYEPFRDDIVQRMLREGVTSLGTLDIGRISHTAPALRLIDLGGLTDREIARQSGDYRSKSIDPALLELRRPDAFLFTSRVAPQDRGPEQAPKVELFYPVERELASTAWFLERYRVRAILPVRSDFYLCWYERLPSPRPRAATNGIVPPL
jgi:hypothetical protein